MSEVPLYRVWGLGAYGGVVVVGKVHEASLQIRYPAQVISCYCTIYE